VTPRSIRRSAAFGRRPAGEESEHRPPSGSAGPASTQYSIIATVARDLTCNRANEHLVRAIVGLAQGFGHLTIAEGVEDAETLDLLGEYGVDFVQGCAP
jgi:EAL domain